MKLMSLQDVRAVDIRLGSKFANASFIASLLVVTIHLPTPRHAGSVAWWCSELVGSGVSTIAVPFFFFASGFFLMGHANEDGWYSRALVTRLKTVVVPYFLWSMIAWVICFLREGTGFDPVTVFGLNLRSWPPCLPVLWYLRALFLFVLLSPLIRQGERLGLWLIGLCFVSNQVGLALDGVFLWTFRLTGVAMFALGMYLRSHPLCVFRPNKQMLALFGGAGISLVVAKAVMKRLNIPFIGTVEMLAIPLLLIVFWKLVPERKWPKALVSLSFPIYLLHMFAMTLFNPVFKGLLDAGANEELARIALWMAGVGLSGCFAFSLDLIFPSISSLLFGGRVHSRKSWCKG